MKKVTRLFYWNGRRYEPGDLFDTKGLSVGQVASLRRLAGLKTYNPYKRKKKTKTSIDKDESE